MNNSFRRSVARAGLIAPCIALFCYPTHLLAGVLGSAQSFSVLGYAGVTNTGNTQIYGNVGVSPLALTSITGFPPAVVTGGGIFAPPSIADQALADINSAAVTLAGLASTSNLSNQDLGNRTLTPGVYFLSDLTANLTGTLILDAEGITNAQFVFQLANALTTASASAVNVINADAGTEVYWVLGSSATLGSSSTFAGNILAYSAVTINSTATINCGRAFARTESVTLNDNLISGNCTAQDFGSTRTDFNSLGFSGGTGNEPVPEPTTVSLLVTGLGAGFLLLRRSRSNR